MWMNLASVNWILGCVQSASLAVLINGSPSNLFGVSRGLQKGCPLSPFLFILVEEGIIKVMKHARNNGELKGLKVNPSEYLSHIIFVGDVLMFGTGSLQEF
jgi:hypothetical protein